MLPIYVSYDSKITDFEQKAIIEGLKEISSVFPGREVVVFGSMAWSEGDYSSADWYVARAKKVMHRGRGLQLDAASLLGLMTNEPWQRTKAHIDVFFTSYDLTAPGLNFCFGMTSGRLTVQSVARYRVLPAADRYLAIKSVVQHELGHVYGLAGDLRRPNTEQNLGPHCTNYGCIMRQSLTLELWVQHAREARAMGRIYCPSCLADARRSTL